MKNIGILFDVSGSMKEKFDNYYIEKKEKNESNESNEKRADEIIKILENISKNLKVRIFSILFGFLEPPFIVDFTRLLKISIKQFDKLESNKDNNNEKKEQPLNVHQNTNFTPPRNNNRKIPVDYDEFEEFDEFRNHDDNSSYKTKYHFENQQRNMKKMTSPDMNDFYKDNNNEKKYREELINLLSHDEKGNKRYCNIKEYVYGKEGPSERFSEFVVKLMKKERKIIDEIYCSLPKKVTSEFRDNVTWGFNKSLNALGVGLMGASLFFCPAAAIPSILAISGGLYGKSTTIDHGVEEETIIAIKNGFRSCIKNISSNIMDIYKKKEKEIQLIQGSELLNLIQYLKDNIEYPKKDKNESFDIIDIFEDYIYGDTPLYTSCQKAFGVFEKNNKNKNYLIIISDGLLNDTKNYDEVINYTKKKSEENNVIIIGIYLNQKSKSEKKFYDSIQNDFDKGCRILFQITTTINYHNPIIKFFINHGWEIPESGESKLFVKTNNSKDLNDFIDLLNKGIQEDNEYTNEYTNANNKLLDMIGNSFLLKIVDENYIKQFDVFEQKDKICWLYSFSTVIYFASSRIFGRKLKIDDIKNKIWENEGGENKGKKNSELAEKYLYKEDEQIIDNENKFRLRYKKIDKNNESKIRRIIIKGRPCLASFGLTKNQWKKFYDFFKENPKGILTKNDINSNENKEVEKIGHAVVLIAIEKNCLVFLNSYGEGFGDKGYFRVENSNVLHIRYYDIYWDESCLTKKEKDYYYNIHLEIVRKTCKYLMSTKDKIEELKNKNFDCLNCSNKIKYDKFTCEALNIQCPICLKEFDEDDIPSDLCVYIYLNNIIE